MESLAEMQSVEYMNAVTKKHNIGVARVWHPRFGKLRQENWCKSKPAWSHKFQASLDLSQINKY